MALCYCCCFNKSFPLLDGGGDDGVRMVGIVRHVHMLKLTGEEAAETEMKMCATAPYSANVNTSIEVYSHCHAEMKVV